MGSEQPFAARCMSVSFGRLQSFGFFGRLSELADLAAILAQAFNVSFNGLAVTVMPSISFDLTAGGSRNDPAKTGGET